MKNILCAFIALFSAAAFGATLTPIQLLNPTGSSSGQTIVSTGASSAPAWGTVPISGLSPVAANTVVANATASSAVPTAFSMPSCNSATSVLQWTSGTGFACLTSILTSGNAASFSTLATTGNDALVYDTTNALSLPTATVVTVTTFTKVFDRVNANFNATSGVFTAPATGVYQVCANFSLASGTGTVGGRVLAAVQVGGSTVTGTGSASYSYAATTQAVSVNFCSDISVTSGQLVTVVVTQNFGVTRALDGSTSNWISIHRIP